MPAAAGYRFGQFVLNLDRGCLQKGHSDLDLRPKAFDVLRYLVERAGRLTPKDELIRAIWPNVIVSDDSLAQCIRDIRKVLNDEGEDFIRTVPRRGYMFVAETVLIGTTGAHIPSGPGTHVTKMRWSVAAIAAVAAFAVLLAALAAWSGGWFEHRPPITETRLTIAILPFVNLSDRQGEDWLGDGIAEDIMTAVSRFHDLTVIGRNSSFRYRGDTVDVRQVGRELNAHYVLRGSVQRSGDRLRISVQLVDTRTGANRWAERYDRPLADVFAIQDEVADSVAGQLAIHAREAAAAHLRKRPPENLEAYELVLRGRKAYRTFTREGSIEARALSERALTIDPNYAAAWEVLASVLMQFYIHPYSEHQATIAMLQQARAAAEKAASLDGNFSTAQATLGFSLLWSREHEASLTALRKAIRLNPNDAIAHSTYGDALSFAGLSRDSIKAWERAERLDPFAPALWLALQARPHVMLGEFEQALRLGRSCAQRAPRLRSCFIGLAIAANELGLVEEARTAVRRILEIDPGLTIQRQMRLLPFRHEADAARYAALMRRAGIPD